MLAFLILMRLFLMKKKIGWLFCAVASLGVAQAQKGEKPNILFIAVDDLKPELGCYGNKMVKSPNIDRLAKMGTVFMSNYCQQAVCGPTRASLMTGMRPDHTKVWDLKTKMRDMNPDIVTLPQYLASKGYVTSGIGKIYHPSCADKQSDAPSWTIPFLKAEASDYANGLGEPTLKSYRSKAVIDMVEAQGGPVSKHKQKENMDEEGGGGSRKGTATECLDLPDDAYEDGVNAKLAVVQLAKLTKDKKPFFFAVGFHKPHLPFVAPKKYWELYNREEMPLAKFAEHSKNGPEIAYHNSSELRNYTDIPEFVSFEKGSNHIGLKTEKQKELIHGYYSAISYMDAQVGLLLKALDSLGITKNTIIVLWGDHGWHLGDHDLWEKHTNFEQATRSPLIVAAPGMKAGQTKSLSEHVDVFPTVCALAGVAVPEFLEGKSLAPLMKDNKVSVKEFAMSQYPRKLNHGEMTAKGYTDNKIMGYSLRTDRFRYTLWMNNGYTSKEAFTEARVYTSEMYDFVKDPLEKVNVVNDANYAKESVELKTKMIAFFTEKSKK